MFRLLTDAWKRYWWGTGVLPDRDNKIEDIHLRFYNGRTVEEYIDIPIREATKLLDFKGFDKDSPTVLYIHGFIEVAEQESVKVMASAYLEARPGTNVVLLDWSNMSHGSYLLNAARNTKKVGEATAVELNKLFEKGVLLENFHIIGHSLGSHVAGYAARVLKHKFSKIIKRVTALDPAFPAFYPDGVVMEHVNANDADFVDTIHTDAGGYGAPCRTGTADFWPNGGKSVQPGCPRFAPIPLSDGNVNAKQPCCGSIINRVDGLRQQLLFMGDLCSHWRSWRFYAESVRTPEMFPASPAESYHKFKENPNPEENMVYMGYKCVPTAKGSYYLTTNSKEPFGKGLAGIYCGKKNSNKS